jgi:hypothetical protein
VIVRFAGLTDEDDAAERLVDRLCLPIVVGANEGIGASKLAKTWLLALARESSAFLKVDWLD